MNLNDLKEMCNRDTTIGIDLDGYSISIPELANKYHQLAFDERKTLRFLEAQYDIIKLSRWKYYSGKANPDEYEKEPFDLKVLKSDMDMFLKGYAGMMSIMANILPDGMGFGCFIYSSTSYSESCSCNNSC